MFKLNKYYKWYQQIISNAKIRLLEGYTEEHHIIPKCLGGLDSSENLVKLTAREHFICHWLLTKFVKYDVEKMKYALWLMTNTENSLQQRYKITPKKYEIIKQSLAETFSKQHKGRKMSEETKRKISETRKKKFASGELEIKVYDITRKKLSKLKKGKKRSQETKEKIGAAHKGKKLSEEQKQYLSSLYKDKPRDDPKFKEKLSKTLKEQYASGERVSWNKGKKYTLKDKNGG